MVVTFSGVVPPNSHPAPHFRWHDMIIQPMTSKGSQLAWVPEAPASVYTLSWNTYYVFFCQAKELTVTVDSPWGGRNQQGGSDMVGKCGILLATIKGLGLAWSWLSTSTYRWFWKNPTSHKKPKVCSVPPFPWVLTSNFNLDDSWLVRELLVRVLFQVYPQVVLF